MGSVDLNNTIHQKSPMPNEIKAPSAAVMPTATSVSRSSASARRMRMENRLRDSGDAWMHISETKK